MVKAISSKRAVARADPEHQHEPADEFHERRDQTKPLRYPAGDQPGGKADGVHDLAKPALQIDPAGEDARDQQQLIRPSHREAVGVREIAMR